MGLLDACLNLLFPPKCPFCRRVLDRPGICPDCEKVLPWIAEGEGLRQGPGGLWCAAPLWYEGLAREGLLHLKFHGASAAAAVFGELIARCAAERYAGAFDTVTWVPISKKRLRGRGYDQARLLAESACRLWDVRPAALLRKTVDNPAQSGLTEAAARRANVLGVYELIRGAQVTGARILLVDDICTTGATLTECVRVLREGGAADVVCVAVALTREKKKGEKSVDWQKDGVAIG